MKNEKIYNKNLDIIMDLLRLGEYRQATNNTLQLPEDNIRRIVLKEYLLFLCMSENSELTEKILEKTYLQ